MQQYMVSRESPGRSFMPRDPPGKPRAWNLPRMACAVSQSEFLLLVEEENASSEGNLLVHATPILMVPCC